MFRFVTAEHLANQARWRIRKIVRELLLLPQEGEVIDMFVPAEKDRITNGGDRSIHDARHIVGEVLRVVGIGQKDVPKIVMVPIKAGQGRRIPIAAG